MLELFVVLCWQSSVAILKQKPQNLRLGCFRQQTIEAASDVTPHRASEWNPAYLIIPSSVWVWEDPLTRRTGRPLCSALTLGPSCLRCQATHWLSTLAHTEPRFQTQDGVGRVIGLCVWLAYVPAPTSHSHLTYTPRPGNSFNACKCRAFHCNVSLWGQFCPSELSWASENRHHQPHSLGCYF